MNEIRLGTFTRSVLLDVAREQGALAAADLDVVEIAVSSSPAQFASLEAGELDAVFTSPDNVIAYRFIAANPLGRLLDIELVAGLDRGLGLTLGLRPGLDQLHPGVRFGVDVPNSGFAFVGYAMLEHAGLSRSDYEIVTLGSTPARAAALLNGGCDVTILGSGNELRSRASGCALAGSVSDLGPYIGTVLAHLRGGGEHVASLMAVLLDTARGIIDGRLEETAALSAERILDLPPALAREHAALLREPPIGLIADGAVDRDSLDTLVRLRNRFLPDADLDGADYASLVVLPTAAG